MGKNFETKFNTNEPRNVEEKENYICGTEITEELFPIVGIGASAGGFEALEIFLKNVPAGSGMAFVFIQHLDPINKGIMSELLQRSTSMAVFQVIDGLKVKPDCVYVIPPNKDMSIFHGILYLLEPIGVHGLPLPVDFFFRSLAEDQQERSIGVILSGMGTDGTLGVRAIKGKAGLVLVQNPSNAKYDSMPNSAINSGMADIVASVEELPGKIITSFQHFPIATKSRMALEYKSFCALEKIEILLRTHTGNDFSLYKSSTIYRRIERRMGIHRIDKIDTYISFLQENDQELEILFKELLIGVTSFFRDPAVWEEMKKNLVSYMSDGFPPNRLLRAWVAGCSTGEEAYSLAILYKETLEQLMPQAAVSLQIFATDLDKDSIDKARQGFYPENIVTDVSAERISRFFIREENGFRVCKEIREMIIFAPQNVITDPPFTRLDILTCRNLLIYLNAGLQKRLMSLFHFSLNTKGILLLGKAETIGNNNDLFAILDGKNRLFKRLEMTSKYYTLNFPASFFPNASGIDNGPKAHKSEASLQLITEQIILNNYSPSVVLVNDKGDILYINGKTGRYLEPATGKVDWNIFAMAREEFQSELTGAFSKAMREKSSVTIKNVNLNTNKEIQVIKLTVQYIKEPEMLQGMLMVIFLDQEKNSLVKTRSKSLKNENRSTNEILLEHELQQAHGELQLTQEEMQTSQEELKSANEELQSANEELQSTIEELTTSKEESQSINEELYTVNAELHSKLGNYSNINNDMKNMLNSTEIATMFLDGDLNILRFTDKVTKIIKLIPRDVGRSITDITSYLIYDNMEADFREVIKTNGFIEKQLTTYGGCWFLVRIMPYKTIDSIVDGIVITFLDISVSKSLEMELREKGERYADLYQEAKNNRRELYASIIENIETLVFSIDSHYSYTGFNKNYAALMKNLYGAEIEIGKKLMSFSSDSDYSSMKKNIDMALKGEAQIDYLYLNNDLVDQKYFKIFYNPIWGKESSILGVMMFSVDAGKEKLSLENA
ncbi:MAG TPA: chemotaxis protein CheB [Ruminiclostridium sp.]